MINSIWTSFEFCDNLQIEALLPACHILNRVPRKDLHTTPYKLWIKRKPNANSFRVWGCLAHVKLQNQHTLEVGYHWIDCVFVNYFLTNKRYSLRNLEMMSPNTIVESLHANIFETVFAKEIKILEGWSDLSYNWKEKYRILQIKLNVDKGNRLSLR